MADRSLWVGLHRDPSLYEHAAVAMPDSDEAAARGFTDCLDRWESAGFDYGIVVETNTRTGIGVGGLRRLRDEHGEQVLNLYYRLAGGGARPRAGDRGGPGLDRTRTGVAARPAGRHEEPRRPTGRRCAPRWRRARADGFRR